MLRLAPADEPPAEEADEAAHDDYYCDGDARDRPAAEAALVDRGVCGVDSRRLRDVAGDSAGAGWSGAAHAVGDALDSIVILRALHTRISRSLVVPREALSTSSLAASG